MSKKMTATRPYLLRAFYDWIIENHCTPHIVVNAHITGVQVPNQYVEGGKITLNISMEATSGLHLGNQAVSFKGRFGGVVHELYIPMQAIGAIYAMENGKGMVFTEEEGELPPEPTEQRRGGAGTKSGGHLKVGK